MESRILGLLGKLTNDDFHSKNVYKYHRVNKFLYDLLINNEIWFAQPFSFNDPFDCNLTIDGNNTAEQIKNYYQIANWGKSKDSDAVIRRLINKGFQDKAAFQEKINSISKKVIGKLGLACFTQTKDNLLMWAHYTEDHKGICLEFDHTRDSDFFRPLKKVDYDEAYPIYNYYNDKNNVVEQLMLHKSNHWKYEEEIRLIKEKSKVYLFKPESLVGIYFGVKTPNEQTKTIMKLVREGKKYNNTKFYKAKMDSTDYRLIFDEI